MNKPITQAEVRIARKEKLQSKLQFKPKYKYPKPTVVAVAMDENRRNRRLRVATQPVMNNRKQTRARKGNRLYLKMARFAVSLSHKMR